MGMLFFTSPRLRGEVGDEATAKSPGEGDYPRVSLPRVPLTLPSKSELRSSRPRKRGEGKNDGAV